MLLFVASALAGPAYDLLRARDAVPCAALGEATPALRDELLALTAPDLVPSAVPMRAVGCLAERFGTDPVAEAAFVAWPADGARPGEVLVLLGHEAELSETTAAAVVQGALGSANSRVRAKAALVAQASLRPAVHGLVK